MKKINVIIPENVVNEIQLKDLKVQSMQGVISSFLEMHSLDNNTVAIESPVFQGYQKMLCEAKKDFEDAKNDLIAEFVEDELKPKVNTWNLDYNSCELVLQIA